MSSGGWRAASHRDERPGGAGEDPHRAGEAGDPDAGHGSTPRGRGRVQGARRAPRRPFRERRGVLTGARRSGIHPCGGGGGSGPSCRRRVAAHPAGRSLENRAPMGRRGGGRGLEPVAFALGSGDPRGDPIRLVDPAGTGVHGVGRAADAHRGRHQPRRGGDRLPRTRVAGTGGTERAERRRFTGGRSRVPCLGGRWVALLDIPRPDGPSTHGLEVDAGNCPARLSGHGGAIESRRRPTSSRGPPRCSSGRSRTAWWRRTCRRARYDSSARAFDRSICPPDTSSSRGAQTGPCWSRASTPRR